MSNEPVMPDVREASLTWIERTLLRWYHPNDYGLLRPRQVAAELLATADDHEVPPEIVVTWLWAMRRVARDFGERPFINFSTFTQFATAYQEFQEWKAKNSL